VIYREQDRKHGSGKIEECVDLYALGVSKIYKKSLKLYKKEKDKKNEDRRANTRKEAQRRRKKVFHQPRQESDTKK
jgi:hypothetical protein